MLIYSKKVDEKVKLFGTLSNIPSDEDELLTYTDGEGKEVEPALSLSQSFVDGGKHSIKRVEDGKEIKVFIGDVNVIPGESSPVPPTPVSNPYLTFSSEEPFTLNVYDNTKHWDGTLEYSTDTENWTTWDGTTISSNNNKLFIRGNNNTVISGGASGRWVLTGSNISCIGNIENLLDYQTVANEEHPQMGIRCYDSMFRNCTSLTTAPELPATTFTNYCYTNMFVSCTSLTTAPQLPATTLTEGCYYNMFDNCTSLITPPELPATTLANGCYGQMFLGCTSLTTAPQLSATTLAEKCYRLMFSGCTSLTTAPELPATILANQCYVQMFQGCTSLTTAPQLPATTLTDYCYSGMFRNCASLTAAPTLPATTLASSCYSQMFVSCTSLTTAPKLPATTLASNCYSSMFQSCISLKLSETQDTDYTIPYRIPIEGTGIVADGALAGMFASTGGTFKSTPTINTPYYLHKDNHIV